MLFAGICWALAVVGGLVAWLWRVGMLGQVGLMFVSIACMLTVLNDNARTRRVVRLSLTHQPEPGAAVRSLH